MMTVVVVVVCMGKSLTVHEMVLVLPSDPPHRHSLKKPKKNSSQLLRKQNGSSSDNTSLSYCNISIQRFQRLIKVYIPKPNFEEAPHSPHLTPDGWYSQTRSLRKTLSTPSKPDRVRKISYSFIPVGSLVNS